ncbi:hypothetical protein [Nocardioides bizhenqiangii]|uniref:hypothetical protein n=1 Tax=Nocardioides bizhenqiangii TaxID=3095076 RepID=UPI002ACC1187|nr:hypothetical protein [Nocardioides sp. HM23]
MTGHFEETTMFDIDDNIGLRDRMDRAVGGLRAPDVTNGVMAKARRHRTHRRVGYAAGGVAVIAAAGALGYPLTQGTGTEPGGGATDPGYGDEPSPSPKADPTGSKSDVIDDNGCRVRPAGWWDMPADQVTATLADRLPRAMTIGKTEDASVGIWSGNLVEAADPDFASVRLLPPPAPAVEPMPNDDGTITLCATWEPMQTVEACDPAITCEVIRDDEGNLVGVITEKVEATVVNGQDEPTDKSYILATLVGPDGGHVEIYVGEGTRDDRPDTQHDPADQPALTVEQVKELLTDPVWTSYTG